VGHHHRRRRRDERVNGVRSGDDGGETRLPGGNVGGAVLVDGTVRRSAGRWTPSIQRVLGVLADAGIDEVPRPLGVDGLGREVSSFIPGDTVGDEDRWPSWGTADPTVQQVGRLLRRIHDATRGFAGGEVLPWRLADAGVGPSQVVCHNDVAPYNLVWDDRVVGLIDWDFASPGDPRTDLAGALWQFAPFHHPELSQKLGWSHDVDRLTRARSLVDAYRLVPELRQGLTQFVIDRMHTLRSTIRQLAASGHAAFHFHIQRGDLDDIDRSVEFVEQLRPQLEHRLTS
jgi:phage protein U